MCVNRLLERLMSPSPKSQVMFASAFSWIGDKRSKRQRLRVGSFQTIPALTQICAKLCLHVLITQCVFCWNKCIVNVVDLPSPLYAWGRSRDRNPAPTFLPRTWGRTTGESASGHPGRRLPPRTVGSTTPHAPARTCTQTGSRPCIVSATKTTSGLNITKYV